MHPGEAYRPGKVIGSKQNKPVEVYGETGTAQVAGLHYHQQGKYQCCQVGVLGVYWQFAFQIGLFNTN
ncbi:MAG: hypothetical protein Roseis2KO_31390 [Roseivirga sp.]